MELRRYERMAIDHPIVYSVLGRDGKTKAQGVGRALDINPNGLMMETSEPISEEKLKIRISTSDGRSIAINGDLIYSMPYKSRTYRSGIKLNGTREAVFEFFIELHYVAYLPA